VNSLVYKLSPGLVDSDFDTVLGWTILPLGSNTAVPDRLVLLGQGLLEGG
jgi:hypothetical protein